MATTHDAPPFHCAAFAITSRQTSRRPGDERWCVNPTGLDWDDLFAMPQDQREYDETAFTELATRSGWRLTRVVPAGQHRRRLYFERTRVGPAGAQDTYRQQTKEQSMAQDDAEPAATVRFVSALLGLDIPAADPWRGPKVVRDASHGWPKVRHHAILTPVENAATVALTYKPSRGR